MPQKPQSFSEVCVENQRKRVLRDGGTAGRAWTEPQSFSGFQTHLLHLKLRARFFRQLASYGIGTRIFFDNAFDGGLQGDGNALIELTRQAFERGRQLIIVTRAEEGDREIDNLSGPRAIAPQQDGKRAEHFLWSEHLARQHLNRTVTTEFKKRQDVSVELIREW